jgi:hypothetical protein
MPDPTPVDAPQPVPDVTEGVHSRTIWTAFAVAVLLVSLVGPLTGAMTVAARIVLECMHVAVAASLIAALALPVTST